MISTKNSVQDEIWKKESICFLDVKITWLIDGTLKTGWYTEPTNSNTLLNYYPNNIWAKKWAL